jgi:hypothetical protein
MIAAKVASSGALDKIAAEWRMPKELASDLVSIPIFQWQRQVTDFHRSSSRSSISSSTSMTLDPWPSRKVESELTT